MGFIVSQSCLGGKVKMKCFASRQKRFIINHLVCCFYSATESIPIYTYIIVLTEALLLRLGHVLDLNLFLHTPSHFFPFFIPCLFRLWVFGFGKLLIVMLLWFGILFLRIWCAQLDKPKAPSAVLLRPLSQPLTHLHSWLIVVPLGVCVYTGV